MTAVSVVAVLLSHPAGAVLVWQSASLHQGPGAAHAGGHGDRRRAPGFILADGEAATIEQWSPNLARQPLETTRGSVTPKGTGVDNYHALVATRGNDTAVRYVALRGKPSDRSPGDLFAATKAALEIVPTPYAREHARYTAGRHAVFTVRLDGQPLARHTVALETTNGTRRFKNTDGDGVVTFLLPEDFADVQTGRSNNAPADFVVSTTAERNGQPHRFAMSADYHVNPRAWQSVDAGLASALAGLVSGLGFLRLVRRGRPAKG